MVFAALALAAPRAFSPGSEDDPLVATGIVLGLAATWAVLAVRPPQLFRAAWRYRDGLGRPAAGVGVVPLGAGAGVAIVF
jgi:hypothetical protein